MTVFLAGMRVTSDRLNDYTPDETTTTGLTASANWAVNDFYASRSRGTVILDLYLNRTGGTITATVGNITDVAIATLPAGWRPNLTSTITATWGDGSSSGECVVSTDGIVTLRTASNDIILNRNLRIHISFNKTP
jgi:hypothetical protein